VEVVEGGGVRGGRRRGEREDGVRRKMWSKEREREVQISR
jgi:hypothetical protein